jgi:hypothetical protein
MRESLGEDARLLGPRMVDRDPGKRYGMKA